MLHIENHYHGPLLPSERLTLPFELRQKSRLRCLLDSGEEAGLHLARGTVLRGGDLLQAADGRIVAVVAAPESLSVVNSTDPLLLARVAYHLGNRHVAVQIVPGGLRYLHDHVLDDMVGGLGLQVGVQTLPFEPEGGAYGRHDQGHHSAHAHDHAHVHEHGHHH
jgi:urease accessory protein